MHRTQQWIHSRVPAMATVGLLGLVGLMPVIAQAQTGAPSRQAPPGLITYACSVTMPSATQRLVFVEALDKAAARRLADRARLVDAGGKRVPARSVQECIEPAKEKFIDAKAAELLANALR